MFRQAEIFQPFSNNLIGGFTDRHGGVSQAPFNTLNLAHHVNDRDENVTLNRQKLADQLAVSPEQFRFLSQVHSDFVIRAGKTPFPVATEGDALITRTPGIILGILVADCAPVLIYDPKNRAVGAAHAGWRGCAANIVTKTLDAMRQAFGTDTSSCHAVTGPCISGEHYEIGPEVAEKFSADVLREKSSGKFLLDIKKHIENELREIGIPEKQIQIDPSCTFADGNNWFSYRRENRTGRFGGFIGLKE